MDDLLDLNFSSPPKASGGASAGGVQRTLNGTPVGHPGSKKPDAFDFLLSGSSSAGASGGTGLAARPPTSASASASGSQLRSTLTPTPALASGISRNGTPGSVPLGNGSRSEQSLRPSSGMGGLGSGTGMAASSLTVPRHGGTPGNQNGTASSVSASVSSSAPINSNSKPNANAHASAKSGADAFQDLFALSGGSASGSGAAQKQSLADRQAQVEREKREREERNRRQFDFDGGFLDGLGGGQASTPAILAPQPVHARPNPTKGLGSSSSSSSGTRAGAGAGKGSFWDTNFAASSASTKGSVGSGSLSGLKPNIADTPIQRVGSSAAPPEDPFDFDALARATPVAQGNNSEARMSGNGLIEDEDDDFLGDLGKPTSTGTGSRAGGSGGGPGEFVQDEDDDLLGDLGRPVQPRKASPERRQPTVSTSPSARTRDRGSRRPTSPPPHIIGQLVEMGYTPAQARTALASTSDGMDVQGAVEILLSGIMTGGSAPSGSGTSAGPGSSGAGRASRADHSEDEEEEDDDAYIERERQRREEAEAERRRARRAGPSRASVQPRTRDAGQRAEGPRPSDDDILSGGRDGGWDRSMPVGGTDADKYIQQATAIGTSMLGKASGLWAAGKERAQKLYEEQKRNYEAQQRAMAASDGGREGDGYGHGPGHAQGRWGGREGDIGAAGPGRTRGAQRGERSDGRPKWMVDAQYEPGPGEERSDGSGRTPGEGFRDDDGSDSDGTAGALPPHPSEARRANEKPSARGDGPIQRGTARAEGDTYRSVKERADSLFSDPPRNYVPAHRRKPAAPSALIHSNAQTPVPSRPASRPVPPAGPPRSRTPLIKRHIPSASASALAGAGEGKLKGNEHFKLGRFAEAEAAYTSAISKLPEGHLGLVALYNNRATVRLKLGEWAGAVEDASGAIGIVGPGYHPSKEEPLRKEDDCMDVKLAESMVKAHTKRAQAREMGEKYKDALEDWEKVVALSADPAFGSSGAGAGALEGVRRARKALNPTPAPARETGNTAGGLATASAGPGRSTAASTSSYTRAGKTSGKSSSRATGGGASASASAHMTTENSLGVSAMRAAAAAAAKENDQRLAVQDSVDAKIASWKGGKETNLRALIASLDSVLWPEIMGAPAPGQGQGATTTTLKVGMHELISEKQVKVRYMRVVSRLHPDKLNTSNTTVEQRLIANAVFGALSEAWQAFQNGS